jgi:hypothetical protein
MIILVGIYVGSLLMATAWSTIRGSHRIRRRRVADRPHALH